MSDDQDIKFSEIIPSKDDIQTQNGLKNFLNLMWSIYEKLPNNVEPNQIKDKRE